MPFQSEKQRRYLWANEPEIARDWTDTYGSRIRRDNGGGMGWADQGGMKNYLGEQPMVNAPQNWRAGPNTPPTELAYVTGPEKDLILQANMHGSLANGPNEGPSGIMSLDTQGDYTPDRSPGGTSGGGGGGDREAENIATQQAARQKAVLTGKIQKDPLTGNWEAGRNLGRGENVMGLGLGPGQGPQLGLTRSRIGGGLGNWASQFAGSKIGGGLGSMLFGPWGMLLGSLFGRGVGKRGYQAYQTPKRETWKDIAFGENTLLSNLFNKKKTPTPTDEGLGGIDLSDMRDKRSVKDYIDLSKSYSEFDTIPNPKYHGLNVGRNYMGEGIGPDFKLAHHKFDPSLPIGLTGKERNEVKYVKRAIENLRNKLEFDDNNPMMDEKSRKFNEQQLLDNEQKLRNMLGIEREA